MPAGFAISRQLIFVLKDGAVIVDWGNGWGADLERGEFIPYKEVDYSHAIQDEFAELGTIMHETFTGARVVKAYNLEGTMIERFVSASRRYVSHFMRMIRSQEIPGPLVEFLGAIGLAWCLLYIGLYANPRPSAGDFSLAPTTRAASPTPRRRAAARCSTACCRGAAAARPRSRCRAPSRASRPG